MVCAFIVMKCEGFTQITDLMDYLDNNRIIAHYCGFNIMEPLPSYWTYDRFLKKMDNAALKEIMAAQVKKLYEMGIVDASFIGLDSTPVTTQNPLQRTSSPRKTTQKATQTVPSASTRPPTSTMSGGMSSTGGTRAMCWWTASPACRSTS